MAESIHDKLKRVRKPRVHITYDVETNGAEETKELPFVVGVMGDYSGDNTDSKKSLKERKFVNVDRDTFNDVMNTVSPELNLSVENTMTEEGGTMAADLKFRSMEDFEPQRIVEQVEPLKKLMDARNKLRDLLSKADRSEELEGVLEQILQSTDSIAEISGKLNKSDEGEDK